MKIELTHAVALCPVVRQLCLTQSTPRSKFFFSSFANISLLKRFLGAKQSKGPQGVSIVGILISLSSRQMSVLTK